jgi:hypothetical protein
MLTRLFSITCVFVLFSCSKQANKEVPVASFPITLSVNSVQHKPGLRLFTKNGEVMNADVAANKIITNFGFFNMTNQEATKVFLNLNFVNADSVKFVPSPFQAMQAVQKSGTSFLFISTALSSFKTDDPLLFIRKHLQPLTPAAANSGYAYITHLMTPAIGTYNELDIPFLSVMTKKFTSAGFSQSVDIVLNELDPTVYQKLGINDTLVVQESTAHFK